MCRSDLFTSSTFRAAAARAGLTSGSRSVTSLWMVVLLTPKTSAQVRTVAPVFRMYCAASAARN